MSGGAPAPTPAARYEEADFIAACRAAPDSVVYFLVNVGDGDMQLVLLPGDPEDADDSRRALVVDVAVQEKLPALVEALVHAGILPERKQPDAFAVVVGTHPHDDHLQGMPQFVEWFKDHIVEYWDCGYYHPTSAYSETMTALERLRKKVLVTQPTSGMTRFINSVKLTTVAPGVALRNRYDTYGVNINDASITIKLEFPASRIIQKNNNRHYTRPPEPWSLLLGADAQLTSWAQATVDFPQLHAPRKDEDVQRFAATRRDWLRAHVFKIPHHASKHGVSIELVERIRPNLSLISSVGGRGRYGFPHQLAVETIREGIEPTTSGQQRSEDHELGIYYTSDRMTGNDAPLGTIALIVPPRRGSQISVWRFGDTPREPIDLANARRLKKGYG